LEWGIKLGTTTCMHVVGGENRVSLVGLMGNKRDKRLTFLDFLSFLPYAS